MSVHTHLGRFVLLVSAVFYIGSSTLFAQTNEEALKHAREGYKLEQQKFAQDQIEQAQNYTKKVRKKNNILLAIFCANNAE